MNKIIRMFIVCAISLSANNLVINNTSFSYKENQDTDYLTISENNSTKTIIQKNLWANAPTQLNLSSANKEFIKLNLLYEGNDDLGYIYTFQNKHNKLVLTKAEIYQLHGNRICDMNMKNINQQIHLYETNSCRNIKKINVSLNELLYASKNYKLKNILTYNEMSYLLSLYPMSLKNLTTYNNIAYYLKKAGANKESAYLLEKILKKYPNRTVAYYNLGDAYWGLGDKKKAKQAYQTYITQMKAKGKAKKIPKTVFQRTKK